MSYANKDLNPSFKIKLPIRIRVQKIDNKFVSIYIDGPLGVRDRFTNLHEGDEVCLDVVYNYNPGE